jgi:hypothetical protein
MSQEQTTSFTSIQDQRFDAQDTSDAVYSVETDLNSVASFNTDNTSVADSGRRRIRKIYCGDGVVEEDEDEEEEKARREEEEKQKAIELRKKMDLEAVNKTFSLEKTHYLKN